MEISLLALIGIGLATMFFGYFFGLFEGRGQGYKKRKNEEASDPSLRPVAPPPAPPPPDNSALKLSLDAQRQPLLDMDGRRIDTTQIAPEQRRRLIELMVMMRPWIDASPVQRTPTGPLSPPPQPAPQPARVQAPAREASRSAPAPAPVPAAPAPAAQPPAPGESGSKPTTMVGQIDAILQSKLAGTPLATRGIRLIESVQGGAAVMVGLSRYAGVGEVPDPEVQAVIRAAIAEWENKYTPG